jgi:Response regulator containing CheY-like receiver domain and AraC-type DNA-binding domain
MKIAIVEDEIRIREGIEKLLKKLNRNYEIVAIAENGDDGLKRIRETDPDIVITDICMPVMDGLEMLEKMTAEGLRAKTIVLSAYSDFEYARSAMKYGVTEYLLKPTTLMDFEQAMAHVEEQVMLDRSRKPAEIGSIDQVFRDLLLGRMKASPELESYLNNNYGLRSDSRLALILCCPGTPFEDKAREYVSSLGRVLSLFSRCRHVTVDFPYRRVLATVTYDDAGPGSIQSVLQSRLADLGPDAAVCCAEAAGPFQLHDTYENMFPYLDWNIALGGRSVIRWPEITQLKTESCIYPMELENRMRAAMHASNAEEIAAILREFGACFQDGRIYRPREVKECYVRFLWLILSFAKETGGEREVDRQKLLSEIMDAKTREELERIAAGITACLPPAETDGSVSHLTVRKAIGLIREYYRDGITLDEISRRLHVTPEYLGTLFHREVGTSFSAYIRNVRMDKAKELLCETELKLYEIAEQTGYSDPKYFSRVFREATGLTPAEYRKNYQVSR